ncbi:hypothetical protein TW85_06160 [Marinomonas sp. S3726]|uniref:sensor histidine kinase n=1 Tax=Marinomonas sp. S3726 TaxID=579484 RepID=UPI0005F9DEDE|nr:HAMP domain-containing sensor histidine kinase [Marinomonas sp. S3726]KJZ15178.1 hypothetical protein TW85_06160 [Marinomonas sp. S3726]
MSEQAKTDEMYTPKLQEFSYAISHDLGAAIRGISQLTGLLEQDISEKVSDKERYWMQLIKGSADKAQAMIDAMTLYTRLESTREASVEINLHLLIETMLAKCLDENAELLNTNSPDVSLNLQEVNLLAITSHWKLLLTSLINNALQFQQSDQTGKVVISLNRLTEQRAKLVIEDNGIGVSESKLAGLTKPFSTTRNHQDSPNLGMGLSYCARIAQLNQAGLYFGESELGGFKVEYEFSI